MFSAWALDAPVRLIGGERAHNELVEAALRANYGADHGGWRHHASLIGRVDLVAKTRKDLADPIIGTLASLRLAGDNETLAQAVRRLVLDGPCSAASAAANAVDLDSLTATTARASLTVLQHAGDVLNPDNATAAVDWILATLADPTAFVARTRPHYTIAKTFLDTLAGVILTAGPAHWRIVVDHLLDQPAVTDQLHANSWARVLTAIPTHLIWTEHDVERALARPAQDNWELRFRLLAASALAVPEAARALTDVIRGGNTIAFGYLGDLSHITEDDAASLIPIAAQLVQQKLQTAQPGLRTIGGVDAAHVLTLLNRKFQAAADWAPVIAVLRDERIPADEKIRTLAVLSISTDTLPASLTPQVVEAATVAARRTPVRLPGDAEPDDARPYAVDLLHSLGAVDLVAVSDLIADLLPRGRNARTAAVRLAAKLNPPTQATLLLPLALSDWDPHVRAAAAGNLTRLATTLSQEEAAGLTRPLNRVADDAGTLAAGAVADALADAPIIQAHLQPVLERLRTHASAKVRHRLSKIPFA